MIRVLILLLLIAPIVHAEESARSWIYDYDLLDHAEQSVADGFDTVGFRLLGIAAASTLIARNHDQLVRSKLRDNQVFSRDLSQFGAYWGSGAAGILLASTQLYFDTANGIAHAESLAYTSLSHISLVLLTRRTRPNNPKEWNSFPSGHTSSAWATASSLSYAYGWKAAIPAYSAAIATMLARISDDRHWFSDTVAGAFLGFFWGRATHFHHKTPTNLSIKPVFWQKKIAMGLQYEF